jgi:RNA polymerase sigma-70 factor (ECF subfamily)
MSGSITVRLVSAARNGDRQAAEALFGRAAKLAYARAVKLTGNSDHAWDIAHDALICAIRQLPRLRKPDSFFAWLRAIVDRSAVEHHSALYRRREDPLSAAYHLRSSEPGPAKAAERQALALQVRRAMESLPPRDRLVVELFYFEDMSCREVADFLKTSRDAVKMVLFRSRRQMRKEMTMVAATPQKTVSRPIRMTMSSGDSKAARQDLLFDHDSRTARFYVELYPVGDASKAAGALGMSRDETASELAWLEARKLIVRAGDLWRCTMPVMNDKDIEVMRPWAEAVAAPVTAALDGLYNKLSTIAERVGPSPACDTVTAVGLFAEIAMRPFAIIASGMKTSFPDRGEFGRRNVAAVSAKADWPQGYLGGVHTGRWESDQFAGVRRDYFLWPQGTDRSELMEFARSLGEDITDPLEGGGLIGFLCSLDYDPVSADAVGERTDQLGLKVADVGRFLADLERLHAIVREGSEIKLAIPVVAHPVWQPFLDELDDIGKHVAAAAANAADDLRERMVRCSFAECDFNDSVGLCMRFVEGLVAEAIRKRERVEFPEKADFSWGMIFVC